ncbi:MAG: beta/gamma crystallin-related protein [Burkholderiales bacterium]
MNKSLRLAAVIGAIAFAGAASASITFYEDPGFRGKSFTSTRTLASFDRSGFNDKVSAVDVRGERWEVCEDPRFNGRCVVLQPGRYPSMGAMGLNDKLSSARPVARNARFDDSRYAPVPVYDPRPRPSERMYQANVTGVRAVVGPPEQRCWVEREQVSSDRRSANIPAGIAGAVIGGILGHQVGGGTGKDLATAGGAIGGAVIGANIGRGGAQTQDVRRCENVPGDGRPDYWDVSYVYRGVQHRVQMQNPPGATITVNAQGEPRV